jgi:hypothetical protein
MTPQNRADRDLQHWQSLRHLDPESRIEALMASFWAEPMQTALEYEITLNRVAEEMSRVE